MTLLSLFAFSGALIVVCTLYCYERGLFTVDVGFAGFALVVAVFGTYWFIPTVLATLGAMFWL
jgi:hypothetical protein